MSAIRMLACGCRYRLPAASEEFVDAVHRPHDRTGSDAYFLFFAGITGDTGRSHIDAEYAKRTSLGKPSAHGLMVASLTALGASNLRDKPEGFVLVEQGCRFLKPVVAGDTLAPEFEVEKIWEDGHRTFCRLKTKVVNQRAEVVLDGFHLYRVIPPKTSV